MLLTRRKLISLSLVFPSTLAMAQVVEGLTPYPLKHKRSSDAEGRSPSSAGNSKSIDKRIATVVGQVDGSRLMADVKALQDFGTRHTHSPSNDAVGNWLRDALLQQGHAKERVRLQEFAVPGAGTRSNVLLWPRSGPKSFILVCAHFDSISGNAGAAGVAHPAPGADDNATGVATLLEVARLLRGLDTRRGIMLAAFSGEEQGLFGSQACAKIAAKEKWPIDVVLNLDMVGYVSAKKPSTIIVEYDQGNKSPANDAASKLYALQTAQAAVDYTNLSIEHTNIWSSDYMPFEADGVPAIGLYDEGGDEAFYHSTSDTIANVDRDRLTQIAKLVVASSLIFCELT